VEINLKLTPWSMEQKYGHGAKEDTSRLTAAEMRLLRSILGNNKTDRIRNEITGENIKINSLEGKLTTE
jgi:hypothetical protein